MSKYRWIFPIALGIGLWTAAKPAFTQALLPYIPSIKANQFEDKGISLAQQVEYLLKLSLKDSSSISSAVSMSELSTQLAPNRFETWQILGLLYAQQKQYSKSLIALNKSITLNSSDPQNYFILGRVYFEKGDYRNAQIDLEKGLKIKPDFVNGLFDLGNAKFKLRDLSGAIIDYQKALSYDKKFWPALNNIGLVRYEQGNISSAIKSWEEVIKIENKEAEPILALAVVLYQQGHKDSSYHKVKEAFTLDNQYTNIKFLKDNLWGEKLLENTQILFNTPYVQNIIKNAPKSENNGDSQ